jgi:hypothetical protein
MSPTSHPSESLAVGTGGFLASVQAGNVSTYLSAAVSVVTIAVLFPDLVKKYFPKLGEKWFPAKVEKKDDV